MAAAYDVDFRERPECYRVQSGEQGAVYDPEATPMTD